MNSALVFTPVLAFCLLALLAVPILFRLFKSSRISDLTPEWYDSFSVESYHSMQGLLASDDFKFLSKQPGFSSSLYRKLRRDRLRIFRQYLNKIVVDFNRLYSLASLIISQSKEDHSALFSKLLRIRVHFCLAVMRVELSYLVCRLGVAPAGIESLLGALNEMSQQLTELSFSNALLSN